MTELTLEALRSELAAMERRLSEHVTSVEGRLRTEFSESFDSIKHDIEVVRSFAAGIPLIGQAIETSQERIKTLNKRVEVVERRLAELEAG